MSSSMSSSPLPPLDPIQRAALREGICLPEGIEGIGGTGSSSGGCDDADAGVIRLFSTAEAIECLTGTMTTTTATTAASSNASSTSSPVIELVVAGDSYNQQLFIGLADILLATPHNDEIYDGRARDRLVDRRADDLRRRRNDADSKAPPFPDVRFVCTPECRGQRRPFSTLCSGCINRITGRNNPNAAVAAVVGAGVHIVKAENRSIDRAVAQFQSFLVRTRRVVYNSMPSYQTDKVPPKFRNASHHAGAGSFYARTLAFSLPRNVSSGRRGHPFVDYFQLTKSCYMENCSYDGGHRSRYVNRWKAQLLLNTVCEVVL